MAGSTSTRGMRRLRGLLLGALLALLVVIGGLFIFGRTPGVEEPPPITDDEGLLELLLASEGWEYEVSDEGRPVFRIRGARMLSDRDNNVVLEGVGLTLYREGGDSWELQCSRGSYNRESQEAILEGDVRIDGSTGLTLFTDGVTVGRGGRMIRSTAAVRFQYQGLYTGRADQVSVNLASDVYLLDGEVEISSLPTALPKASLRANRLVFESRRNLIRALGSVRLRHGQSALRARRLSAYLTSDRRAIEFIRARSVDASSTRPQPDGLNQVLSLSGANLSIVMDPATDSVRDLELQGASGRRPAQVSVADSTGVVRQLEANTIVGRDMTPERRHLEAYEPVLFREFFSFSRSSVIGWACADRASATLIGNDLAAVALRGNSELWRDGIFAEGSSITFDAGAAGTTSLEGEPARLLTPRGELSAPAIIQIHHSGEIQGHGGIRGRLDRTGQALAGGDGGPLQVEAEEIVWAESPEALLLRGRVRVWQDEQLLIAEEIEENVAEERLEARGGVRSVFTPPEKPEGEEAREANDETRATASDEPIEVTAASAVYDRPAGLVTYAGGSRATQGLRTLQGEEIELRLSEEGEAESIECRDNVVLRDRENRRTVKGDLAVYRLEEGEVRISGERVTLQAEDGTKMEGPVLIYEIESGKARVESEDLLDLESIEDPD